jgi:hypothetical protein
LFRLRRFLFLRSKYKMVNLVVRQYNSASPLQNTKISSRNKSSPMMTSSMGSRDRMVPSPVIRVPSHPKRPVSPLTASESIFGGGAVPVEQSRSQSPGEQNHRGGGVTSRLDPVISRDSSMDEQGDLICDYDQNVTALYELLESSQWDQARLRCRTYPDEVQTWIVRRDATSTRWKLLPLHAAVIFQSPAAVLESMLLQYPLAAGKRDDQGMLPLHLALRHKQEESMLELLLAQYPQAVMVKDRRDRLPIEHAGDTQFSASLMQKYAEACFKCQKAPSSSSSQNEVQVADVVKRNYENQIVALCGEHEQELLLLQQKMEQEKQRIRKEHDQEMDELRDLLSREVATGQRERQNEQEILELQQVLSQANSDNQILRGAMQEQKLHYDDVHAHVHKILEDQKTLQGYCEQQQRELEEAQLLREQLLRSLAQKDGALKDNSREICRFSKDLRLRTEQILSRGTTVAALQEACMVQPENGNKQVQEWAAAQDEGNQEDVDDNISAITDDNF